MADHLGPLLLAEPLESLLAQYLAEGPEAL
jgi:hypothetical protein